MGSFVFLFEALDVQKLRIDFVSSPSPFGGGLGERLRRSHILFDVVRIIDAATGPHPRPFSQREKGEMMSFNID